MSSEVGELEALGGSGAGGGAGGARTRAIVHASDGEVAAAGSALVKKGNAVDAVLAGLLAACALERSPLLSPVQILVGGAGAGLRAVDGRLRQPGLGVPRPRGFRAEETIPEAAWVAVPVLPAVVAATLASLGSATLAQVLAPALDLVGPRDPGRKNTLRLLLERGGAAFSDRHAESELVAAAGRLAGGVLTAQDLGAVRPSIEPCVTEARGSRTFARAPWSDAAADATRPTSRRTGVTRAVVASDARGLIAVALYEVHEDGLAIDELGLLAPRHAVPVLRGERRVNPGQILKAASPMFLSEHDGLVDIALALCGASDARAAELLEPIVVRLSEGAPLDLAVRAPREPGEGAGDEASPLSPNAGYVVACVRSRDTARPIHDPRR